MAGLEDFNGQNVGGVAAAVAAIGYALRLSYIFWTKSRTGIEQSNANTDLYKLLREDINALRKELRLTKKQLAVLEMLAAKHGIDVQAEYAKRN